MTDKVVVLVTAASKKECRKIAKHLVEGKLAACVNITQSMESIYHWEGKSPPARSTAFHQEHARIVSGNQSRDFQDHSYHTPEIICLPIIEGRELFAVVGDSVKAASPVENKVGGREPSRPTLRRIERHALRE